MKKDLLKQIAATHDVDPVDLILDCIRELLDEAGQEPRYVDFEMQHIDANPHEGDDAVMKCYIDGYPAGDDATGTVIACVTLTRHGDVVVDWHHNGYRMEPAVLELIENARQDIEHERSRHK